MRAFICFTIWAVTLTLTHCDNANFGSSDFEPCSNIVESAEWMYYQTNHKPQDLNEKQLQAVANFSNPDHFKDVLLKPLLQVREVGTPGHAEARAHIVSTLRKLGWNIEENTFTDDTPIGHKTFTNVIATHDMSKDRRLVLACHYDSKYYPNMEFIGATDSAVPCAMLLDLATRLKDFLNLDRSLVTVQLIFLDGEEAFRQWTSTDSIYGARHLAQAMENRKLTSWDGSSISELQAMDVFVLLDLIGAANPTFRNFFAETDKLYRHLQKLERRMAKLHLLSPVENFPSDRNTYFESSSTRGGIEDDHIPFLHRKVPVLHLIAYPFPRVWHTKDDNENALDYTAIDNLNKIIRALVAEYLWLCKDIPEFL